jgi:putative phage-type endonuclease
MIWAGQFHHFSSKMPGIERADLIPLSDAWHKNRKKKATITASNAGTYVGINGEDRSVNTIKDPIKRGIKQVKMSYELLKDPSKNTFDGNWFTRRGNFYEPVCFKVFEAATGIPVIPCVMWQSTEYDWLFATPDGLIDDDTGLEVKNPWGHMHAEPPPHYMAQIQIQMHCSNRTKQYFMSQCITENCARIWLVYYSPTYMAWLMPQLEYLHDCVVLDLPVEKLDMTKFDFKPPYVRYELVTTALSLTDLIGEIEEFPEPPPDYLQGAINRKRGRSAPVNKYEVAQERPAKKPAIRNEAFGTNEISFGVRKTTEQPTGGNTKRQNLGGLEISFN